MLLCAVILVLAVLLVWGDPEEELRHDMRGGSGLVGVCDKRKWDCNVMRGLNMVVSWQLDFRR